MHKETARLAVWFLNNKNKKSAMFAEDGKDDISTSLSKHSRCLFGASNFLMVESDDDRRCFYNVLESTAQGHMSTKDGMTCDGNRNGYF